MSVKSINGKLTYSFSGQALYRGIFFTQGEVANLLPTLTEQMPIISDYASSPGQLDSLVNFQDRLIVSIEESHPEFFDELRAAVYSADPNQIQAALGKAGEYTKNSLMEQPEYLAKKQAMDEANNAMSEIDANQFVKADGTFDTEGFANAARAALNGSGISTSNIFSLFFFFAVVFAVVWGVIIIGGVAVAGAIAAAGAFGYYLAAVYQTATYLPNIIESGTGTPTLLEEKVISEIAAIPSL